jgi:hypothetical protein
MGRGGGGGGQRHIPAALPAVKTQDPFYRRLSGPQGRPGRVRKNLAPTWIRSPDRPARSELLCRLRCRGPLKEVTMIAYKINTRDATALTCTALILCVELTERKGLSSAKSDGYKLG